LRVVIEQDVRQPCRIQTQTVNLRHVLVECFGRRQKSKNSGV
jgi:hypothetical protein